MATSIPKKPIALQNDREKNANVVSEAMKRLDLKDPREALLCLPARFADLRRINDVIPDESDEDQRLYRLQYTGEMQGFDKNKRYVPITGGGSFSLIQHLKIELIDAQDNKLFFSVFGNPWPYKDLEAGQYLNLVGKVVYFGYENPQPYLNDVEVPPAHAVGKIWVKYLGKPGRVAGEKVESLVRAQVDNPQAYQHCATKLIGALGMSEPEAMQAAGAEEYFRGFEDVLMGLHRPQNPEQGWMAKTTANKLAALCVQAAALRQNIRHSHPDAPLSVDVGDIDILARTQKETLTASQKQVAMEIAVKLRDHKPMNVLLSGDVGTGKTLTYLLPAVAAHRAGAQVLIVAPTSILADQIARQVIDRFGEHVKSVERIRAGGKIQDHASILVGTSGSVTVATKAKYIPNLLICDEQHKLSSAVREKLVSPWTHTLEASATPIPRSLASALFGGKDILNLRECPVKKKFNCVVGDLKMRPKFAGMIKHALDNGNRAVVVYPRINQPLADATGTRPSESEVRKHEKESVISGAKALEKAFPGKVIAIHGELSEMEITAAIEAVRSGAKPLVVASTVIETGVDIPGITTMIVRDADYFGISQLHQLRGRLVRHGGEAWFGMMVNDIDALDVDTLTRLQAIEASTDGYELAERDLTIRGFGELDAGGDQSGAASNTVFRLVNLRPEDFLKKKLSQMRVEIANKSEDRAKVSREGMQTRMFA